MSTGIILPVAKSLYTCDGHLGFAGQKSDLIGIFESINSPSGYPYTYSSFVVYARLVQGLGTISFRVDIRAASTGLYIGGSNTHHLVFPNRDKIVNMVMTLKNVAFPQAGIYLVELLLDNQLVADTTLELR